MTHRDDFRPSRVLRPQRGVPWQVRDDARVRPGTGTCAFIVLGALAFFALCVLLAGIVGQP